MNQDRLEESNYSPMIGEGGEFTWYMRQHGPHNISTNGGENYSFFKRKNAHDSISVSIRITENGRVWIDRTYLAE